MVTQRLRERLTLALVALLPFHALFITVATRLTFGPGNPPYSLFSLWKEGVLGVILVVAAVEILRESRKNSVFRIQYLARRFDVLDVLILALIAWSLVASFLGHGSLGLTALGFRYDFVPLVAFLLLRRLEWSEWFRTALPKVLLFVGATVAAYALLAMALPMSFFTALGYSDLHSLYLPDKPIAAFQQIAESSIRRLQGPMSGPNQLGLWLLLPIAVFLSTWRSRKHLVNLVLGVLLAGALLFSFSRSGWIAAFGMTCTAVWMQFGRFLTRRVLAGGAVLILLLGVAVTVLVPSAVVRLSSSRGHFELPAQAFVTMLKNPVGLGLGTAGPASNRTSEACVKLRPQDDPSWAKDRPQLCVFVGDKQVQPLDHACKCPLLTENWYLQIGVEAGIIGFILYLALVFAVLWELRKKYKVLSKNSSDFLLLTFNFFALLAFIAVCIGSVFLHAWEDAAVAWTAWILIAVALGSRRSAER